MKWLELHIDTAPAGLTPVIDLLRDYGVRQCYYGHLHGASHRRSIEGEYNGTHFSLVAADYLEFIPKKICD